MLTVPIVCLQGSAVVLYVEIYADNDGVSHFREAELSFGRTADFAAEARPVGKSPFRDGQSGFLTVPAGWNSGWHQAPGDGFAILIRGRVEIEVGDGELRQFSPGDVWRSTDVMGPGHISRNVGSEDAIVHMSVFGDAESD